MSEVHDIIAAFKSELKSLLENGTVKDPAFFWAGKMSQQIQLINNSHINNISDRFKLLYKISEEYDRVIFGRMEIK